MDPIKVMLVCGSGASSGFMAANIRKAATARGLDIEVFARSESEISSHVNSIDVLMVGPHLEYLFDDVEEYIGDAEVGVVLMDPSYYSTLDGEAALDHMLEVFDDEPEVVSS